MADPSRGNDLARCVLALASDLGFVTGHDIIVDGGRILG